MKTGFLLLFTLSLSLAATAQHAVSVSVTNIRNDKGSCRACIFNSSASFENRNPLDCVIVPVKDRKATATFTGVKAGTYAVFVIHDMNNNGELDTNFLGIPKEGYGASRNKLPFAAAPKFEENKFTVSGPVQLNIRLRNL